MFKKKGSTCSTEDSEAFIKIARPFRLDVFWLCARNRVLLVSLDAQLDKKGMLAWEFNPFE